VLLTILGCSGSVPGPTGPASGYLVEADGYRLAMDLGNGTLSTLSALFDPFLLDAALISHLHPDHCADLSGLSVLRRYHPDPPADRRGRALPLHAPGQAPSRLAAALASSTEELAVTDLSDVFQFNPLGSGPATVGPFEVTAVPVAHPCEAYGFRIARDGVVLAYTGDTGPCDALQELADGADLLLAEASWTHDADRPPGVHLSGTQAGELAARAGVGRLLLTHVAPWTDPEAVLREARTAYSGPVDLAEHRAAYRL
jgi:ribonuclease BN (tRNA processing enzyme)